MKIEKELLDRINKYLKDNGVYHTLDVVTIDGKDHLTCEVYRGDWKHDHGALKYYVAQYFEDHPEEKLEVARQWYEYYEDSDDDSFTATHMYELVPATVYDDEMTVGYWG